MIKLSTLLTEAMNKITTVQAAKLFKSLKLDKTDVKIKEFYLGMNVELEHQNVTQGDVKKTALLVLAHLKESPDYYTNLQKVEEPAAEMGVSQSPAPQAPGQY